MKRYAAALGLSLFFSVLLFGCLGGSNNSAPGSGSVIAGVPDVNASEINNDGAYGIANSSSDITDGDISDEEINQTLG